MNAPSRHLADGSHSDVRWYVERPTDMAAPQVLVTLQVWHGPSRTYVSETHEVSLPNPTMIAWMIDDMLQRLDAKAAANARRVAHLKARVATVAVLLALSLAATGASAQTVAKYSYDAHGRVTGRAELRPDGSVRYFGPTGRETGRSETHSDGSVHDYDEHGRETGTVR